MFCSKCGYKVNGGKFCPSCGNPIGQINNTNINTSQFTQPTVNTVQSQQVNQVVVNSIPVQPMNYNYQNIPPQQVATSSNKTNQIIIGVCVACAVFVIAVTYILVTGNNSSIYFSDDNNVNSNNNVENNGGNNNSSSNKLGVTSVEYDNTYVINVATTEQNIIDVIKEDSQQEKEGCPEQIIEIENRIVNNYEIDAVNLCELDIDFALELEKIVKYIYDEFPTARGYLSHISLGNLDSSLGSTIAFFQWIFPFTESTIDGNLGYKSRIILNSSYYLNVNKFKSDVKRNSNSGHFPKNATIYSPLAHEFAHYLSFIATNNYYGVEPQMILKNNYVYETYYLAILDFNEGTHSKRMIEEAYNNYKMKTGTNLSFDEFRATISQYAVAKDESGQYIWDETIAEAFHDVYLNDDAAADASKEIVAVLRKYVEM